MQLRDYLPDPKTGLHLPASDRPNLRVGIENWINVQRIENGSGKCSGRWRFPNLMLNRGLDEHFKSELQDLGDYGAASEDGTAPVVTDTSLLSEVLRSSASGGIGQQITEVANGHFKIVDTRQLASNGNYNIRKVGFSQSITPGGTVNVAETIKDDLGQPDVVTLDATQSLRMSWERHYYFAPIAATAGTVQVSSFPGQNPNPDNRTGTYQMIAPGVGTSPLNWPIYYLINQSTGINLYVRDASGVIYVGNLSELPYTVNNYVNGDYFREYEVTLSTAQANGEHSSYEIYGLYTWAFDVGQAPTKDNLGKVTIKLPRITLARRP